MSEKKPPSLVTVSYITSITCPSLQTAINKIKIGMPDSIFVDEQGTIIKSEDIPWDHHPLSKITIYTNLNDYHKNKIFATITPL